MKSLKKAATVSFSGFICAMGLTACGKFEALEGQKLVMDPPVEKLVLPQNISEELGEALFVAVEKNGATELGQAAKQDMGQFLGLFDTLGREKIKGISVMKTIISQVSEEDSTVNQEFAQLQVQIFQRAMGRNIELYFDGTLPVGSEKQSLKMVELQASEDNEDIVSYLKSCDQKFSQFSSSLQKDNVFNIKVFASCTDASCKNILVQLQLLNKKDQFSDSRVALLFKSSETEEMALATSSIGSLATYAEAEMKKEEEKVDDCQIIEKEQSGESEAFIINNSLENEDSVNSSDDEAEQVFGEDASEEIVVASPEQTSESQDVIDQMVNEALEDRDQQQAVESNLDQDGAYKTGAQ